MSVINFCLPRGSGDLLDLRIKIPAFAGKAGGVRG